MKEYELYLRLSLQLGNKSQIIFFFPLIKFFTQFSQTHFFLEELFNSMFSSLPIQSCNVPFPHRLNTKRKRKKKERELEKMKMLSKRCFSMHLKDINTIT